MISVNLSASCGATRCHITWVSEKPCSSNSGGPLPPTRAKMRPDLVLIHSEEKPGNRSARSGMSLVLLSRQNARSSRRHDDGSCFKLCLSLPLARLRYMPSYKSDHQEPE